MCNAEFMVMSSLYQFQQKEEMKEIERDAAEKAEARGLGAEALRDTLEQMQVRRWFDVENRKIAVAAGATAVAAAGAGVAIKVLGQQWAAAATELVGAKMSHTARMGMAGDQRKAEIAEIKAARLAQAEEASTMEWMMALGEGFAKGVMLEKQMGTWDGSIFGVELPPFLGGPPPETPAGPDRYGTDIPDMPVLTGETAVSPFVTDPIPATPIMPTTPLAPAPSFENPLSKLPMQFGSGAARSAGAAQNQGVFNLYQRYGASDMFGRTGLNLFQF